MTSVRRKLVTGELSPKRREFLEMTQEAKDTCECMSCGRRFQHPHTGRNRVVCGSRECATEYQRRYAYLWRRG